MKLIAAKPIFNTKAFGVKLDPKDALFRHENEIHVGARFSIGASENYNELDATSKEHVGCLISRGLAIIDNKENTDNGRIAAIDEQAKTEHAAHKTAQNRQPGLVDLINQLVKSNQELVAALTAPKKPL